MLSEKVRIFDKKVTQIRVSEIRVSEIRVSEIRISSNHCELHGAIFFLGGRDGAAAGSAETE